MVRLRRHACNTRDYTPFRLNENFKGTAEEVSKRFLPYIVEVILEQKPNLSKGETGEQKDLRDPKGFLGGRLIYFTHETPLKR